MVFSENTAFFEKIVELKKIQHLISYKKGYIHFWSKMTPCRSHNDLARLCRKPSKGTYFFVPKYRSSDALPAPEMFVPASFVRFREYHLLGFISLFDLFAIGEFLFIIINYWTRSYRAITNVFVTSHYR